MLQKIKEVDIMNAILEALEFNFPGAFDRINNIPGYNHERKTFVSPNKFSRPGTCDIIGCLDGRFIGIEVKTPKAFQHVVRVVDKLNRKLPLVDTDRHIQNQINYMEDKKKYGAYCFFTYDVDHTLKTIRGIDG